MLLKLYNILGIQIYYIYFICDTRKSIKTIIYVLSVRIYLKKIVNQIEKKII